MNVDGTEWCGRVFYAAVVISVFTLKYAFYQFTTCIILKGNIYRFHCEYFYRGKVIGKVKLASFILWGNSSEIRSGQRGSAHLSFSPVLTYLP